MEEPSKFDKAKKTAELSEQMQRFVLAQLGGDMDEPRARATWEIYLDCCISEHSTALVAEAMSRAIHEAARQAGFIRRF
ncbi:TPA: hypothetical protein QCI16_002858 [Enterobacter ludwigii]|uniref:hypothetical protein n=1 Tax=Enterobacter ludwigii TaxID=299767 RepID=UPI0032F766C1|nr:hypothetical protein [Enterobacter ludwigii]HDR2591121.1 hypothetical protein [Enterobacter ludwigii]HDR2598684.1 hypothetical protein [Enterobacter ludwigii]